MIRVAGYELRVAGWEVQIPRCGVRMQGCGANGGLIAGSSVIGGLSN